MAKKITFKPVVDNNNGGSQPLDLNKIDDLITVDIYEGYKKLGRYRLSDVRLKFR